MKQVREGINDYEYLYLLDQLIQQAELRGRSVDSARNILNQALEITEIPGEDLETEPLEVQIFNGRYSTRLLKNPDQVLTVRELIAHQIELLTGE